jgi:2,4-dienoyl-CoA reductase-like NADH-dependent reductase (Old Yellow Enzyme family)/thioredoxin reductase
MTSKYKKLLEPISIGTLELKNRMAMAPMSTGYANDNDGVSQQCIDYFVERAKGGVALIIVGCVVVEGEVGKILAPSPQLRLDHFKYVAGFNRLVDAIKDHGAKTAIQLCHAGRQTGLEITGGVQPIAPSDVLATPFLGLIPGTDARAMTVEEIKQMENAYAAAALRSKRAGFDAVLIDGGAGYGIAQFMSPFVNKRTDEYGGDLQGRMRFPLRIIEKVKAEVGDDYPLLFDLPANEFIEGGITPEESRLMAQLLEKAGILAFRIHPGLWENYYYGIPPACIPRAVHAELAKGIKDSLKNAKVMVGHRINNPELAEEVLEKDQADVILLGRSLIADPEFPRKAAEERPEDICKCIACNIGCIGRLFLGIPISCTVNPMMGKEMEYKIIHADRPKKVLIVGGGVAGMEAARVAAMRGHRVTLVEKSDRLGGQARIAAIPPFKYEIRGVVEYYETQLNKLGVKVELGKEMKTTDVLDRRPEAVIIATGAQPIDSINLPGAKNNQVVTAWDVLTEKANIGQKVVILGGGFVGLETAEFLAAQGKEVTVLEMLPEVGMDLEAFSRVLAMPRLAAAGIKLYTDTKADEITREGVRAGDQKFAGETVVLAIGHKACNSLVAQLKDLVPELYVIGDCYKPRKMISAIHEGAKVARQLYE